MIAKKQNRPPPDDERPATITMRDEKRRANEPDHSRSASFAKSVFDMRPTVLGIPPLDSTPPVASAFACRLAFDMIGPGCKQSR